MVNLENMPVKAEDIGRLDANTESLGIPAQLLMECAGLQATNNIDSHFKLASRESPARITVFCGRGKNGGDGFVVARHLATRGHRISVALLGSPSGIGTDIASLNWTILQKLKLNIFPKVLKDSSQVKAFCSSQEVKKSNLLVDALLGTGIKGKIREPVASAIDGINDLRTKDIPVVSLDV